ncbi:MAG: phosphate ABC transporter permease subunit PstC [Bdellovibrionales bacterium]|nr:phosphate ABC transporter permease subunit PstC [Bdellovibrionales bacterium]
MIEKLNPIFVFSFFKRKERKKDIHAQDRFFYFFLKALSWSLIFLFFYMLFVIFQMSWPAFSHFGMIFFINADWNSWTQSFGALSLVYGTVVTSVLALLLAVPVSVGVALFLSELAPKWLAKPLSFIVEMLAAVPSIVYGLWGLFVLAPVLRDYIQSFLSKYFHFLPFFQGPYYGVGMMCGGVILAIMIIPTISSVCREVFRTIPKSNREAVLGLGATRWEMLKIAVLRGSSTGIIGAVIMGLGRALGETMAVTMVIGNAPSIKMSLFEPAQTMASILANQYAEADNELHLASLTAVGFTLFFLSLIINILAFLLVWKMKKSSTRIGSPKHFSSTNIGPSSSTSDYTGKEKKE